MWGFSPTHLRVNLSRLAHLVLAQVCAAQIVHQRLESHRVEPLDRLIDEIRGDVCDFGVIDRIVAFGVQQDFVEAVDDCIVSCPKSAYRVKSCRKTSPVTALTLA